MAGSGTVSNTALPLAGIEIKQLAIAPNGTAVAVAVAGDRDGNGQIVGDNHNHIHTEEVINDNDEHLGVPVITNRFEQPVNRR